MRGAAVSGKSEPEIVTLFTVRFMIVSVMIFPCTVRFPVTRAHPDTVRFVDGVAVPIPIFHPAL